LIGEGAAEAGRTRRDVRCMAVASGHSYVDQDMDAEQLYAEIASMRRNVANVLASLDESQLCLPSLCAGWDVRTVGAHLAVSVTTPFPVFMTAVIRHGGKVHRANDRLAHQMARRSAAEIIRLLQENADQCLSPPRNGPVAALTEIIIHAGDIYRPLGLAHEAPEQAVAAALAFMTEIRPLGIVARRSLVGLAFTAVDSDVTTGDGEELRGRGIDLVMAAGGRAGVLSTLSGPGVEVLRSRLAVHR
jgi:uncharacterized protein (TIGR03083 family)